MYSFVSLSVETILLQKHMLDTIGRPPVLLILPMTLSFFYCLFNFNPPNENSKSTGFLIYFFKWAVGLDSKPAHLVH